MLLFDQFIQREDVFFEKVCVLQAHILPFPCSDQPSGINDSSMAECPEAKDNKYFKKTL